jgi:RNA polymerase sigma factor (sigma-70 family)
VRGLYDGKRRVGLFLPRGGADFDEITGFLALGLRRRWEGLDQPAIYSRDEASLSLKLRSVEACKASDESIADQLMRLASGELQSRRTDKPPTSRTKRRPKWNRNFRFGRMVDPKYRHATGSTWIDVFCAAEHLGHVRCGRSAYEAFGRDGRPFSPSREALLLPSKEAAIHALIRASGYADYPAHRLQTLVWTRRGAARNFLGAEGWRLTAEYLLYGGEITHCKPMPYVNWLWKSEKNNAVRFSRPVPAQHRLGAWQDEPDELLLTEARIADTAFDAKTEDVSPNEIGGAEIGGDLLFPAERSEAWGDQVDQLSDESLPDPETACIDKQWMGDRTQVLLEALTTLTERERRIFEARQLAEKRTPLERLGAELGISHQRVKQIEARAFDKVRAAAKRNYVVRKYGTAAPGAVAAPQLTHPEGELMNV